jgi:hypothetical protein
MEPVSCIAENFLIPLHKMVCFDAIFGIVVS